MAFDANQYYESLAAYDKWSRPLDDTLYELCRRHPRHDDHPGVAAKCWIIGRTYATGIERQITSAGYQGDSMAKLVNWLVTHADEVDTLIDQLRPREEPLTADTLAVAVDVHGQFLRLLGGIVRKNETPRSFTAKYLHFHCPLMPIYDSVVVRVISKLVRWRSQLIAFPKPEAADEEYACFCYRFWLLYQQAREAVGDDVSAKLLDYHLLRSGGGPA